jgi:hypothetical protein
LGEAVSAQGETTSTPSLDELHALGSAIVSNLSQLGLLSSVLAEHVGRLDEAELARSKLSDRPEDQLQIAGTYLSMLSDDLTAALTDANHYWGAIEQADLHTRPEDTPPQPDE